MIYDLLHCPDPCHISEGITVHEDDAIHILMWKKKAQTSNKDVRKILLQYLFHQKSRGSLFFLALCSITSKSILKTI